MAEQWPFKPLVESSNLSALTLFQCRRLVTAFWFESPRKGMIFESLRAHNFTSRLYGGFLFDVLQKAVQTHPVLYFCH
jgi:hypothetical protein